MAINRNETATPARRLNSDFWKYWTGQTISNLGSSITLFALPLIVYKLTGSALNLGLSMAMNMLPYLLFGLLLGAWTDRVDRKRMMIFTDIGRASIIATIPLMALMGSLSVWWIYAVGFLHSTLTICFEAGQFAAIPSLVDQDDLVTANGRIQASYSAASIAGPVLAGVLVAFMPFANIMLLDSASFVISPVLRNISLMMALVNFISATYGAQLVLFAKERLQANDTQVGLLYSAESVGVVIFSLLAGSLRKRWTFSKVALTALMLMGLLIAGTSLTRWYWLALVLVGCSQGLGILFNINTGSLRQAIVPNHLLGRVISIASVLAWSAIPLGSLLGGLIIGWTGNVALVYGGIGVLVFLVPLSFSFTALGHAERYLPQKEEAAPPAEATS